MKFNKLMPSEIERLAILAEECAEVTQMVGKILRFGYDNVHPRMPELGTNAQRLEEELGNVLNIIDMMADAGDISKPRIRRLKTTKRKTIGKYLFHQEVK